MTERAEVIIVGAGVIGCAAAFELARAGIPVTVIDRGAPGGEASGAAAGMIAPQVEAEAPGPGLDLGLASRGLFPSLAEELKDLTGIEVGYRESGILYLLLDEEDEARASHRLSWQQAGGLRVERLTPEDVRKLEPEVSPAVRGGLFFPDDGQVANRRLVQALAQGAHRHGARFALRRPVTGLRLDGHRVLGVDTADGPIEGGVVVNAAGAWAGRVAAWAGLSLPVVPVRGQIVEVEAFPPFLGRPVFSTRGYLVPWPDGRVLLGSTMEWAGEDASVTPGGLARITSGAVAMIPAIARCPVRQCWAGLRPGTEDHLPVMGLHPAIEGMVFATGHFRKGITLAPVSGTLVRELVQGGQVSWPLDPFRPDRFETRGGQP